eukprot:5039600-Pleurochrysis_carterae.AAC.1
MGCGTSKDVFGPADVLSTAPPGGKAEILMMTPPPSAPPPVTYTSAEGETVSVPEVNFIDHLDSYGTYRFRGTEAGTYLAKQGLEPSVLDDPSWTTECPDKVAKALMEWAKDKGATMVTHWFQPLGSAGIRRGQTGQVHNAMFNFGKDGRIEWTFDGGDLLKGETDGSSYMNGGMRATHTAGGYT